MSPFSPVICGSSTVFPCPMWPWQFWRVLVICGMSLSMSLPFIFSWLDWSYRFLIILGGTLYQHNITHHIKRDHLLKVVSARLIAPLKSHYFSLFIVCSLDAGHSAQLTLKRREIKLHLPDEGVLKFLWLYVKATKVMNKYFGGDTLRLRTYSVS